MSGGTVHGGLFMEYCSRVIVHKLLGAASLWGTVALTGALAQVTYCVGCCDVAGEPAKLA
ncbi:hypothetical protein FH972_026693 [Carpinus fangiana]|uniref:Uncharacterized protein n=1 Tax=Carpinus fangiana TaxID=176857 RepID=A0A5N6L4R9_9ROSI|nr:hypothetical protein FH972_026693 [Carpinus fangiana]